MKKGTAFLLILLCGAALFAADPATFVDLRLRAFQKRAASECRSCEIIYDVKTEKGESGTLTFRQKMPKFGRIDIALPDEKLAAGFDGKNFWELHNGQTEILSGEDTAEFLYDAAFLAIPVREWSVFSPLSPDGEKDVSGVSCNLYRSTVADDASVNIVFAVSKEDGLLRQVILGEGAEKHITEFYDYVDAAGVMLAKRIYCIGVDGTVTLTLRRAAWNPEISDVKFSAEGNPDVIAAETAAIVAEKRLDDATNQRLAQLDVEIKDLEVLIESETKKLNAVEGVLTNNQQQENILSAGPSNPIYRTQHRYRRLYRRTMHYHRRSLRKLARDDKRLVKEYDSINEKIIQLRAALAKKQAERAALTEK